MSRLEELIDELCNDEVTYMSIGKCVLKTENIKWVNQGEKKFQYIDLSSVDRDTHTIINTEKIDSTTAPSRAQQIIKCGDILLGTTRPLLKRFCIIPLGYDGQVCSTGFCILRANEEIVLQNWIYHIISSTAFFSYVEKFQKGASYPAVSDADVKKFTIPVPPLEVQREIIRILDNFTEHIAELKTELIAEITARKKQYEFYYNSLMMMDINVPIKKLGEVCTVQAGGTPSRGKKEYWDGGTIKWLGSTVCQNKKSVDSVTEHITEYGFQKSSAKLMKKNTTLIALVGATIGKIAYLPFDATINQNIAGVYPNKAEEIDPDYVYYACKMLYPQFLGISQGKLAMANLSFVRSLEIPVPSLIKQKRIIEILDRFDKLCCDISESLPAEIKARQKQFEYYRDKLLTFKELGA